MKKLMFGLGLSLLVALGLLAAQYAGQIQLTNHPVGMAIAQELFGAEYVGTETCAECHTEIAETFSNSGHAFKLNKVVDGQPPEYPFTEVPEPPEGYTWDDVAYVIGGYNWKARFVDQEGFIITGDENSTTQYNFANDEVGNDPEWVAYHPGEERPYNCGTCHTTGYNPEGNQDGLPGLIGTWTEEGIMCEECHGPGSLHSENPRGVALKVDRHAAECGDCHRRGPVESVDASGGFIKHHEQYEELFQSKHAIIDCVQCHDPHSGVVQLRQAGVQTVRTTCENCHFESAKYEKNPAHDGDVACIDCHMPRITKSAVANPDKFTGDVRTHLMAIDVDQVGQFDPEGTVALSQVSLDFACKHCHTPGGILELTDDELREAATGYHERPQ